VRKVNCDEGRKKIWLRKAVVSLGGLDAFKFPLRQSIRKKRERIIESKRTGRRCQKSSRRWRRLSESIPGESPLETLDFADRAERRKDMPLDLPKYLRELGVILSIRRRFRRSRFAASVSLLSSSESLLSPLNSLGVGKDGFKGEESLEESPVGSG